METYREPDSGYPEEGPPDAVPDDAGPRDESEVRERSRPDEKDTERAPDLDGGKATGNPRSAG